MTIKFMFLNLDFCVPKPTDHSKKYKVHLIGNVFMGCTWVCQRHINLMSEKIPYYTNKLIWIAALQRIRSTSSCECFINLREMPQMWGNIQWEAACPLIRITNIHDGSSPSQESDPPQWIQGSSAADSSFSELLSFAYLWVFISLQLKRTEIINHSSPHRPGWLLRSSCTVRSGSISRLIKDLLKEIHHTLTFSILLAPSQNCCDSSDRYFFQSPQNYTVILCNLYDS